jgi:hypothetical protein
MPRMPEITGELQAGAPEPRERAVNATAEIDENCRQVQLDQTSQFVHVPRTFESSTRYRLIDFSGLGERAPPEVYIG